MTTKDEALKMRKEQDEYWSKIIKQAEEALERYAMTKIANTHPAPSWQGLSDDEIDDLAHSCNLLDDYPHKFVRAIEAKLKEKNT